MGTVWLPFVSLVLSLTGSNGYFYEPGYDHYYTYSSKSNLLEMHDVTTVIKFRVRPINHTNDGSSIQQLHLDSFVQHSESGYMLENPMKWNLSKSFLFRVSPDGLVSNVHYHPNDDQEVVSLKKVLASTLSGRRLDVNHPSPVTYSEIDHAGHLDHVYRVHRNIEGFMVSRSHQSSDKVKRQHSKTLHYDHKGTVHYGEAEDSITLHNDTNKQAVRKPLPGETLIGDSSSGEFPTIASSSKSHVKLTLKRKHSGGEIHRIHDETELIEDTLLILMIEKEKKPLQEVNVTINKLLECIHSYQNHYAPNRTDCVTQLNDILTNLQDDDYGLYAENEVTTLCKENDTVCAEQKKLFVDLVARKGDNFSQSLVVKHFLRNKEAIEDHVHRCLFHAIAIQKPTMELIEAVEDLCFGVNNELHRGEKLGKTQRRACLTLGALSKIIVDTHNHVAHRLVEKLETWLGYHNETHSKPIISRRKRSVKDVDPIRSNHVVTKMVLLHAIGNAGMVRSRDHILSYMQPNQGVLAWRRAAVHGLRHFSCHESANALFVSSVHDDNDIIREEALAAYKEHPHGKVLKEEHKYVILSESYTYPTVMRLKRDIFEASFDLKNLAIHFAIRVPGIDWQKTIGTSKIGAGFGLVIRNQMELELSPLSGHFEIDVYNTAYAEAHVGLINLQIDIFRALMCYQGHIGYDLNVLKDFGINDIQDIIHIMDKITKTFVDPVKLAVETFKKLINTFKNGGIQKLFNAMVDFVKNLPHTLETMIKRFVQFVINTVKYGGIPWVDKIKDIIKWVRTFFEELQDDIMGFYHSVVDAVTVQVPYIGKKLMDAISSIVSSMKRLLTHPMQALTGLSRSVMEIKMSISMFITVKNQLLDALFFLTGKSPFWQNFGEELEAIIDEIKDLIHSLFGIFTPETEEKDQSHSLVTDGITSAVDQKAWIKKLLKAEFDVIMKPLEDIMKFADPFIQAFKDILEVIHGVKNAYLFVKDTVEKAKSTVQKLFGPKFNIKFPAHRREDKPGCGSGVWPTTTNGIYETTGVDVMVGKGSKVRNPVNGMVYKTSDSQVRIEPSDPDFQMYEIIIDNVGQNIGVVSSGGSFIADGKKIGKALRSKCRPNFIHVAVRKKGTTDYVDPSQFLDRLVPVPQWIEECNDHYFKHIGQVFESGELDEEGAKEVVDNLERGASDRMKEFEKMKPEDEPPYMPEGMEQPNPEKSIGDAFKESMNGALKRMGDLGQMITGKKAVNILDIIDLNKYTIGRIKTLLNPPLACNVQLDDLVQRLSDIMRKTPKQHPASLSIPTIRMLLKNAKDKKGDTQTMLSNLLCQAEKECPDFEGTIAKGYSHSCTAHKDCQGIKCGIEVRYGSEVKYINTELRVDSCKKVVYVITEDKVAVPLDGEDHHLTLDRFENSDLNATLIVNGDEMDGYVVVSLSGTACCPGYSSCIVETEVLIDTKFSPSGPCQDEPVDPGVVSVLDMNLEEFQVYLSFYHMMNRDVLCLFNAVREFLMDAMFKDPRVLLQLVGVELDAKMDFCVGVDIPIPPLSIDFFPPQHYLFMVGPVPLSLGFGAGGSIGIKIELGFCILSLKAKVTVTPWLGGKVWGSLAVDIGFARGGIKLIGYLLETRFPITGSIGFAKFPLDVMAQMDLYLTPVRLELRAFAELFLLFTTVKVFDAAIWKYKAPTIHKNIFKIPHKGEDKSPPDIKPSTLNSRTKREGPRGCVLKQLVGRSPSDPAFMIEMSVQDEVSQVKLFYAIGTQRGGTNVVSWTEMGGQSLLVPTNSLPNGIPLYWTVKAGNSNGLYVFTHCWLTTYDNSVPDGRIDPSYPYTSHPLKLSGTVVVFDDSELIDQHKTAIGYSPGEFGSEFRNWEPLVLKSTSAREGDYTDLRFFSIPKEGKLTSKPFQTMIRESPLLCARECLAYKSKCVSFDFEFHSETCDLQEVVRGPKTKLRISGTYKNYERLGIGSTSYIEYNHLNLTHGTNYYMNAEIGNVLGYKAFLTSSGTMVDFTPPKTGPLGEAYSEVLKADGCSASIMQKDRCIDVTWQTNHRYIIDGKGAQTVFNGHKPLEDQLYTISNHYTSVNFDGFHDEESGIFAYTWAVGRTVCGTDIVSFRDPHALLFSPKYWTYSGYKKDLHLEDGKYYVTVQAVNNVVHGGALVTTVCHSTPFTVDTTPPEFAGVSQIMYDEDFDILGIYFKGHDVLSKVSRVDFGLGKTKYDVQVRGYSLYPYVDREDTYIGIEELGLEPGVPAWIRLRLVNNVELFTAGHGDDPILIDRTAPVPGTVLDGSLLKLDLTYQASDSEICAQWITFFDPESGISLYMWGVGTIPGTDDVVKFHNFTHSQKESCAQATLNHNTSYYSTVIAFNSALNVKNSNKSSDGVLVDITPPLAGWVKDGVKPHKDMQYSAESATKRCNWNNFTDPESGIAKYNVKVTISNDDNHYDHVKSFEVNNAISFSDHSLAMKHNDKVQFEITAYNGAGLTVKNQSDGFRVDHTPPELEYLRDTETGERFQSNPSSLMLNWKYVDSESGIKEYRYFVYRRKEGMKTRFWPEHKQYEIINITDPFDKTFIEQKMNGLNMESGAKYSIHVTALNQATMSSAHESEGVIIDTTPPKLQEVRMCKPLEDEELTEDGRHVLHDDPESLTISWRGRDSESGIVNIYVGLGRSPGSLSETGGEFLKFAGEETLVLKNLNLAITSITNITYYVTLKAKNGAGINSTEIHSKAIYVQKANVPGTVYDSREEFVDSDYMFDRTSIAMTFGGFESEACNIVGYEWAVGTQPYYSDVLPYTDYGIVMLNTTHGQGQIHLQLYEDMTYYISVRAQTGHNCGKGKEYIVSCSDGIKVDSKEPVVRNIRPTANSTQYTDHNGVFYQSYVDSLDLSWNVSDASPVAETYWSVGSQPYLSDIKNSTMTLENRLPPGSVTLKPGSSVFLNIQSTDDAGNTVYVVSQPVIADLSAPEIHDFSCTEYVSSSKTSVTCKWGNIEEKESVLGEIYIDVSSDQVKADLAGAMSVHKGHRKWTRDFSRLIANNTHLDRMYVIIRARNVLGLEGVAAYGITVDHSPPSEGKLEFVTRTDDKDLLDVQKCQIPWMYVEINVHSLVDEESGIDRVEIALGYAPEQSDIRKFELVNHTTRVFIDHLSLRHGSQVYATARVYNKAGLYNLFTSDAVAVSPSPKLTVTDGEEQGKDSDYQSKLNVIQGYWDYSDACPILKAEYMIEDLTGKIIQDYQTVPGNGRFFYNDELVLTNGYMYIVHVRVTDALYRTLSARSDGISVRIQTPDPGLVIDGLEEDINYQQSTSELSASWHGFGKPGSKDPIQRIVRYEVAIGNDRRYAKTRANIHMFIDVGLNTSHTFTYLNLTSKTMTYYITVRAYSEAGSYEEATSNGIKVGFRDGVIPGIVETTPYQSDQHTLSASWSGFESDIGLTKYFMAVGTYSFTYGNDTFSCSELSTYWGEFDVKNLTDVGLNTFHTLTGLDLQHGEQYSIAIVAVDESSMCAAATASPIMVDVTPPESPAKQMVINGLAIENVSLFYVTDETKLSVSWDPFIDTESEISDTDVSLMTFDGCPSNNYADGDLSLYDTVKVTGERQGTFYDIGLYPNMYYLVRLKTTNGAGLSIVLDSTVFSVDTSPPQAGSVHIGNTWEKTASFQSSTSIMSGWAAIANTEHDYKCPSQRSILHSSENLKSMEGYFEPTQVKSKDNGNFEIIVGYNRRRKIVRGGIKSDQVYTLKPGNYSIDIMSCRGLNMMTTFSFASTYTIMPTNFTPPLATNFHHIEFNISRPEEYEEFDDEVTTHMYPTANVTDNSTIANATETDRTATTTATAMTTLLTTRQKHFDTENMTYEYTSLGDESQIGFGVTIIGEKQKGARVWDALFWARDKYKTAQQWLSIENDPSSTLNEFTVQTSMEEMPDTTLWKLNLLLNGEVKATLNGLQFYQPLHVFAYTWNKDDYKPPITDIFEFFKSSAVISDVRVPIEQDKACLHGTGFYDPDSGIKEIWVGVSDSLNYTDNIAKMTKYKENCIMCKQGCDFGCEKKCALDDFYVLQINLNHLNLESSTFNQTNISQPVDVENSTTYYMNVKMVNFAGQESTVRSNGIMVDSTPPVCDYMRCTDPTHSIDEQTKYLGSNTTIGAFWSCDEDISQIQDYILSVGTSEGGNDMFNETSFGIDTKVAFNLSDGKYFQHNMRYYVSLRVVNVAGQSSTYTCDLLVQLIPPRINDTKAEPMFGGKLSSDESVYLIEDDENVGVAWNSKTDDSEFYEWSIGTTEDDNSILPKIKVGVSSAGNAAIVKGHLWLNNTNMKKSVSEFANRNWTGESLDDVKKDSTFRMEPGRCMYETMYAEGHSHLSSHLKLKPRCLKRPDDLFVSTQNNTRTISLKTDGNDSFLDAKIHIKSKAEIAVTMEITGSKGSALFGKLNSTDIQGNYGTAASADFISYIVDPEQMKYHTSRSLRHRIQKYENESFFMSPAPAIDIDSFEVSVEVKPSEYPNNTLPLLTVWTPETELLHDVGEECGYNQTVVGSTLHAKICLKTLLSETDSLRKRRSTSTSTTVQSPHMFSLFKASNTYYSTPPVIQTDTITMTEDTELNDYELSWYDNEDDCVEFALKKSPSNADVNVSETGLVSLIPYKDFAGIMILTVEAIEIACPGKQALKNGLTAVKNITIIVEEENDEPQSALIMQDEEVIDTDYNDTVDILLEANSTTHHTIGSFFLVDVDFNDNLTILTRTDANKTEAEFTVREVKVIENLQATGKKNINTAKQVNVDFNISPNFSGIVNYTMLGYDQEDYISQPLKIQIFSLISPCMHGKCAQKTNISQPCRSKIRALTFDPFICECDPGYEGHWCETETNECRSLPCPLLYDCIDLIATYSCVINPGKLVAILICVAVGIAVAVFVIKRIKRRNLKLGHYDDDSFFSPRSGHAGLQAKYPEPELLSAKPFREHLPESSVNQKPTLRRYTIIEEIEFPQASLFLTKPGSIAPKFHAGVKKKEISEMEDKNDGKGHGHKESAGVHADKVKNEKFKGQKELQNVSSAAKLTGAQSSEKMSDHKQNKSSPGQRVGEAGNKSPQSYETKGIKIPEVDEQDFLTKVNASIKADTPSDLLLRSKGVEESTSQYPKFESSQSAGRESGLSQSRLSSVNGNTENFKRALQQPEGRISDHSQSQSRPGSGISISSGRKSVLSQSDASSRPGSASSFLGKGKDLPDVDT